jgi:gluconokinase
MSDPPLVWMIIGVSGSGKTSVGRALAAQLECDFLEGDRRHPDINIQKMSRHQALADVDRQDWLTALSADIGDAIAYNRETVITCSALKVAYRAKLTKPGRVQMIWLDVPEAELRRRVQQRQNFFMTIEMLDSQLATFEAMTSTENVIIISGNLAIEQTLEAITQQIHQQFPSLKTPWWQRIIDGLSAPA